jgi:dephospho-CoA kinase
MHIVGLTGGIGSGKSMAALFFKELNVPVIDLDDIAKEITTKNNEGYNEIVKKFGVRYLNDKKEINRYLIKAEIFNDPKLKKEFEQLIHPLIYTACLNQIDNFHTQTYLILIVPLLFETKTYLGLIQESLLIDCKITTQKERVCSRDKLDSNLIDKIIASQLERSERQEKADNIITNDGSVDELKQKIKIFHDNIIKRLQND